MSFILLRLALAEALLLAAAPIFAQTTPSVAVYTGPRYPGGPDSLRALVGRSTRTTIPAPAGKMLVQFELQPDGKPYRFSLVTPPVPLNKPLLEAGARALPYLESNMAPWQPIAPSATPLPEKYRKINLVFDFALPLATQPNYYADQNPVFPNLDIMAASQNKKPPRGTTEGSTKNLIAGIQKHSRYPSVSLRENQQGTVYAYFEVAENGAIEHREVLGTEGTIGTELRSEVLRVMELLPAATTPATVIGRPVRVYYALPITFKIQ